VGAVGYMGVVLLPAWGRGPDSARGRAGYEPGRMPAPRSTGCTIARRISGALLVTSCCLALFPAAAGAHAHLLLSSPADGATVTTAPGDVQLLFSGTATAGADSIQVFGPDE